jgi:tetrahydromethanopterin S-methyltransferase subunit A
MASTSPEVVQGNPASPVAVCTLSSHALLHQIARSPLAAQVAMLGPLETENLGIERMLTTLLRSPRIRWLVVCGDESRGRYQGQALIALFEHGIGPKAQSSPPAAGAR